MKNYREMDLIDLALSITFISKVLRDRVVESRIDTYPVKKEIVESMKNLIDTLEKIKEIQHYSLIKNIIAVINLTLNIEKTRIMILERDIMKLRVR